MTLKKTMLFMVSAMATLAMSAQSIQPKQNEKDGKWGYISTSTGKWVVKPKFSEASALTAVADGQLRATVTQNGKTGFIDDNGKILGVGVKFEKIEPLYQGSKLVFVTVNGKKGIADYNGTYVVKPEATDVTPLADEGWFMTIKGKQGLVNVDGQWIVQPLYNSIDPSEPGYFIATKGNKASLLDRNGSVIIEPKEFSAIERFNPSLWKVSKGEKAGLYDLDKRSVVVKPEYADVAEPLQLNGMNYYPVAKDKGKWGVLDTTGKDVVKTKYSKIENHPEIGGILLFQDGSVKDYYIPGDKKPCKVYSYGKYKKGPFEIFEFSYDKNWRTQKIEYIALPDGRKLEREGVELSEYKNGAYLLSAGKKASLYSAAGELITSNFNENEISTFGKCIITQNKTLIAPNGEAYLHAIPLSDSYPHFYIVSFDDKTGAKTLINKDGELVGMKGNEFKSASIDWNGRSTSVYVCRLDDKYGIISTKGDVLFPQKYSFLKVVGLHDKYLVAKEDGLMKVINTSKNNAVKAEFDMDEVVRYYTIKDENDIKLVGKKDGRHGLFDIDKTKWIVPAQYDSITSLYQERGNYLCFKNGTFSVYSYDKDTFIIPESKNYSGIDLMFGIDGFKVHQGDRIGVVDSKTWQELIAPASGVEDIDYDYTAKMIVMTVNGNKKYYSESGKPVDTTPRIINNGIYLEHGRTQGGKNATFANFDISFMFYDDCFTVYCDVFYKNGQKVYRGSRAVRGEDRICASGPRTNSSHYFTFDSSDLGIKSYESRVDYYIKFRFVNERTGKEVNIPGNKKLPFYWHH